MEELSPPWGIVRVASRPPSDEEGPRADVLVPSAVLWREGPDSFFACSCRFSQEPPARVDLGPLARPVYTALINYLLTDAVLEADLPFLAYAADVFLLDRLATRVQRFSPAPRLCLNCRSWVVGSLGSGGGGIGGGPCRYKPSRRMTACGLECVACGRASKDCRCARRQAQHALSPP